MTKLEKCPSKARFCCNVTALLHHAATNPFPPSTRMPSLVTHSQWLLERVWVSRTSTSCLLELLGRPIGQFLPCAAPAWAACGSLLPQPCLTHVVQPREETLGDKPRRGGRRRHRNRAGAALTAISAPRGAAPALGAPRQGRMDDLGKLGFSGADPAARPGLGSHFWDLWGTFFFLYLRTERGCC